MALGTVDTGGKSSDIMEVSPTAWETFELLVQLVPAPKDSDQTLFEYGSSEADNAIKQYKERYGESVHSLEDFVARVPYRRGRLLANHWTLADEYKHKSTSAESTRASKKLQAFERSPSILSQLSLNIADLYDDRFQSGGDVIRASGSHSGVINVQEIFQPVSLLATGAVQPMFENEAAAFAISSPEFSYTVSAMLVREVARLFEFVDAGATLKAKAVDANSRKSWLSSLSETAIVQFFTQSGGNAEFPRLVDLEPLKIDKRRLGPYSQADLLNPRYVDTITKVVAFIVDAHSSQQKRDGGVGENDVTLEKKDTAVARKSLVEHATAAWSLHVSTGGLLPAIVLSQVDGNARGALAPLYDKGRTFSDMCLGAALHYIILTADLQHSLAAYEAESRGEKFDKKLEVPSAIERFFEGQNTTEDKKKHEALFRDAAMLATVLNTLVSIRLPGPTWEAPLITSGSWRVLRGYVQLWAASEAGARSDPASTSLEQLLKASWMSSYVRAAKGSRKRSVDRAWLRLYGHLDKEALDALSKAAYMWSASVIGVRPQYRREHFIFFFGAFVRSVVFYAPGPSEQLLLTKMCQNLAFHSFAGPQDTMVGSPVQALAEMNANPRRFLRAFPRSIQSLAAIKIPEPPAAPTAPVQEPKPIAINEPATKSKRKRAPKTLKEDGASAEKTSKKTKELMKRLKECMAEGEAARKESEGLKEFTLGVFGTLLEAVTELRGEIADDNDDAQESIQDILVDLGKIQRKLG